ncbi:MAG: MBL fold metallo-hydrolase [Eubacteriales bacterium]|nr:MBL fold metallo-hydrolase [Eubacteriales bacterium]
MDKSSCVWKSQYEQQAKAFAFAEAKDDAGKTLPYRLFSPETQENTRYPLVLVLHGAGERGDDNNEQLEQVSAVTFADPDLQAQHPCFVMAPQVPLGKSFFSPEVEAPLFAELKKLLNELPVDTDRVYITGLSMGGMGTWAYIAKYPRLFAAAMPIAGAGDPFTVPQAGNIPIWAFHGAGDPVVSVSEGKTYFSGTASGTGFGTRALVRAMRNAGNRNVRYTEYADGYMAQHYKKGEHWSWVPAYTDPQAREWLFAQRRDSRTRVRQVQPGLWCMDDCWNDSLYLVQGKERAVLIDTGMGERNMHEFAAQYTPLPVACAITHAHGDHMMRAGDFDEVYVSQKEELLPERMRPSTQLRPETIRYIKGGDTIDLGGVTLEVVEMPGHTPGSVAFVDHAHKAIFTGDAVSSGTIVLMAIPGAWDVKPFRAALVEFLPVLEKYEDYAVYGGHGVQEAGVWEEADFLSDSRGVGVYNPICKEMVQDMIALCDGLLDGSVVPVQHDWNERLGRYSTKAQLGRAGMVLFPEQIR